MADNLLDKASILLTPTAYNDGSMLSIKPENGDGDFTFSRGSAATRVNAQGLVENVQIISPELVSNGDFSQEGSELVTNGDFSVDSNWIKDSGWSIANGKASCDGTNIVYLTQTGILNTGTSYKVQFDIVDYTSGSVKYRDNGLVSGQSFSNVGSYTDYVTAGGGQFRLMSENFIGSIDNISVKEVGQNWDLGTGWSVDQANSKVIGDGTMSSSDVVRQIIYFTQGNTYRFSFTIEDYVSGSLFIREPFNGSADAVSANGTYSFDYVAGINDYIDFRGSSFVGSITNISVKEITDDTDLPRIDYTDGCGSWLLEGQSTNLVNNSELLNTYFNHKVDTTITDNYGTSPSGETNSSRIQFVDDTSFCYSAISVSTDHTSSVFVKGVSGETVRFGIGSSVVTGDLFTFNGLWQRIDFTASSATQIFFSSYGGATTRDFEAFGLQLEALSYATSYIPTNGSIATRLADVATNSGNATLINSTEGVLYAEIAALADDLSQRQISIDDGTGNNRIVLRYNNVSNNINAYLFNGTVQGGEFNYVVSDITEFSKIAFKYKQNDFALWVDGIERATDTSGNTFSADTLKDLSFDFNGSFDFYGKVKALAVFKEALTDAQLQSLTTI